jgi:tRNA dimethylallyltransferase
MSNKPKIVAIVGPTASGKTALGIALAKKFDGEIVSADSRQIYRGMDIGTAKPTIAERRAIPHHLIDIKNPDEEYTVADYKTDAIAALDDIITRGKLPIIVGGTGLYIKTVLENLDIPKTEAHPELRAQIESEIARDGLAATFKKLVELDPEAASVVDPKNSRRVVRALEVAIATGTPFTSQRKKNEPLFETLVLGLNPPMELLRERIDKRVDAMMRDGLIEEIKVLTKKYGQSPSAFDAIGYRETIAHLNGTLSQDEAMAVIKMNTWHYTKRQMTWFKKDKAVHWIESEKEAVSLIEKFLSDER